MMGQLRKRQSNWARAFAALATLAFALRAITPVGYMLAPAQDGRFLTVTLCSQHGAVDVVLDRQTGEFVADADQKRHSDGDESQPSNIGPCVFAASANLALPTVAPAQLLKSTAPEAPPFSADRVFVGAGLAAPPPWATGPPQIV